MTDHGGTNDQVKFGDEAITQITEDQLELKSYIFGMLRTMERAQTPFTVGVYGSWGSGKTSFLNLLEDAAKLSKWPSPDNLEVDPDDYSETHDFKWRVVRVNPWECDTPEDAKRLLASSLWAEVANAREWGVWAKLRVAGRRYHKAVVAAMNMGEAKLGVEGAEVALKSIGDAVDALFSSDASLAQQYRTYFKQDLKTALSKQGRLLVLIDDLDRAPRKVIPEVLETIKLYLNQKECVFVLAADPKIVAEAVSDLYKPEEGKSQVSGEEYLEKLVQLPFYLPRLDDTKTEEFFTHCAALMCEERGISEELKKLLIDDVLQRNPRAIKRFCMTHGFLAEVAPELDPNKLAKVLGIQMAFPDVHKRYQLLPEMVFRDQQAFVASEDTEQDAMQERQDRASERFGPAWADEHVGAPTNPRLIRLLQIEPRFENDEEPGDYLSYTSVAAAPDGEPGDRFDRMMEELEDEDVNVRAEAALVLGELGDARAVDPLIKKLQYKDEDASVREEAAWALGRLGDARAVDPLIEKLQDDDAGVRVGAVWGLGELGDARAVLPLIKRLDDNGAGVCEWAVWALGRLGDAQAVLPLIKRLEDKSAGVREEAVGALGQLGDARALPKLHQIASSDEDDWMRGVAKDAIRQIEAAIEAEGGRGDEGETSGGSE